MQATAVRWRLAACLPNLLPGGRQVVDAQARVDVQSVWGVEGLPGEGGLDADAMLGAAAEGRLRALVVGGVEPADMRFPAAAIDGLENADFVVSLESRESQVTERADVVFPVSVIEERSGTFVDWEGRERPLQQFLNVDRNVMSDLRVLAALADGLGADLGFRTPQQAKAELDELGPWDGARAEMPREGAASVLEPGAGEAVLAAHREMIDDSRGTDGEPALLATARTPVVRMNEAMAGGLTDGDLVEVSRGEGRVVLPLAITEGMADGVVWLPMAARGLRLSTHLGAVPGDLVRVAASAADSATHSPEGDLA
ncbi:hypothetical protein GCM10027418_27060 [Mariniluteicoccus endophyticus]